MKVKKLLTIIILCIVFILIYLLQINFFNWFTLAGVKPNLYVIFALFIGLYSGKKCGISLGIIFGLIIDILGNNVIGQSSIALGLIGFLGGYLDNELSKDSKITIILLVIGLTAAFEIFSYFYRSMIISLNIEISIFIKKLIIEIIFNALLTIILYPLMQKMGYKIEEIFKNPKILTRYF